jgi:hypothetical protein
MSFPRGPLAWVRDVGSSVPPGVGFPTVDPSLFVSLFQFLCPFQAIPFLPSPLLVLSQAF